MSAAGALSARQLALLEAERVLRTRLAPLQRYFDDPATTEIMINRGDTVFVENASGMTRVPETLDEKTLETVIYAVMAINTKEVTPIMNARLEGLRVAAALPPVSLHGPMLTIRKHASRRFRLEEYVAAGAFDRSDLAHVDGSAAEVAAIEARAREGGQGLAEFLRWAVRAHKNILIVGGTGSGKTTLLQSCLMEIPDEERIITCEDTHEIVLDKPNLVQFEAAEAKAIGIRDLIKLCLRSRPDRIIVGEIRGPEAYDFLDSMNTGHSGSICTLHADSAFLGLRRLESLIRMSPTASNLPLHPLRAEIASAMDYVVFQSRYAGKRGPEQVLALTGVDDTGEYQSRLIFDRHIH